jgi:hypothetical protein
MKKILLAIALSLGLVTAQVAQAATPFMLGAFPPTPGYNGGAGTLELLNTLVGEFIPIQNYYIDFTQNPGTNGSTWLGSNNFSLGGFTSISTNGAASAAANPWAAANGIIPMGHIPMEDTASGAPTIDALLQNYIAGDYDAFLQGVIQQWNTAGYKTQYYRPGVEMNLSGNGGTCGTDSTCLGYWRGAFQHIYTVMHAEATSLGDTIQIIWNPGADAGGAVDPTSSSTYWPGAAYVDIIGLDLYGNAYPDNSNNTCSGYTAPNLTCENAGSSPALSLFEALTFAKNQGKPIAFPEAGAGGNSDGTSASGGLDNPLFFQWLSGILHATTTTVAFVSLYDSNGGCTCAFTPTGSAGKPTQAAAVAQYFGATSSSTPSPSGTQINGPIGSVQDASNDVASINLGGFVVLNGTQTTNSQVTILFVSGTTLYEYSPAFGWFTVNWTTGAATTASSAPSGYTAPHAASASNTQVNGTTGSIYDTYGNQWAINGSGKITVNGTAVASSSAVVTLFWTGTALDQLNSGGQWYTQPLDSSTGSGPNAAPSGYSAPSTAITISPTSYTLAVNDYYAGGTPFTGLTIADGNSGQTETATISLSTSANGILNDPNSGTDGSTNSGGVITITGTPAAVSTDVAALVFVPAIGTTQGAVATTTATVGIHDTAAQSASATSTITATHNQTGFVGGRGC